MHDESAAVLLAVGARESRLPPIEGADSNGVIGGIDFLRDVFTGKEIDIGPKVVVIGGGNDSFDVARTSIRQKGVESVTLVCIEEFEQMLADKIEIEEGEEEGIERINSCGPQRVNADGSGHVKSVTFKRSISVFDSEGRFHPRYDESEIVTITADTVFFSMEQTCDLSFLENDALAIERTERGMIKVGLDRISTSVPGLFVAG
ncbi:MAG: FAD-dependent oxidoreductase, partial [Planctomycetes bacterium]|nr:FAD-dependent oxidoreductase [Planctomycetota bacterium]